MRKWLLALIMAGHGTVLAATAEPGLLRLRDLDRSLATISYRLATRNTDLCPSQQNWSGLLIHDLNQYAPAYRSAVQSTYRLDNHYPAILAIVDDGPAQQAGLQEDESITAIGGQPLPQPTEQRKASFQSVDDAVSRLEAALKTGPVTLTVRRGADAHVAVIEGVPGCASRAELAPGPKLNAAADGETVQVSGALAEFVRNEDELAVIIAHEMAHNILRHKKRLDAAGVERGLLASIGKNASRIRATEEEADYFGLYLAARAGYDISAAIDFWDRFGRKTGWGLFNSPTHPGWRKRQALVRATIAELNAKQANRQPLIPDPGRIGQ